LNGKFPEESSIPSFLFKGKEVTTSVKVITKKKNYNGTIELFNLKVVSEV
jgi:hypothetical protein